MDEESSLLVDGLKFAEGPRWHAGRLWFADMIGRIVATVDLEGQVEVVARFDEEPSGLGFLPDGTLLVVLRVSRRIVAIRDGEACPHADLGDIPCDWLNDMVVDAQGFAYVDAVYLRRDFASADDLGDSVVVVDQHGDIRQVVKQLIHPNGVAVSADGGRLIVAETNACRLTEFERDGDGLLRNPRVFAELEGAAPDGICVDADEAVWVASPTASRFDRVTRGGEVSASIGARGGWAVACALGGPDLSTLFLLSADTTRETIRLPEGCSSFIDTVRVEVPGAR